jgi:hypothetical protein
VPPPHRAALGDAVVRFNPEILIWTFGPAPLLDIIPLWTLKPIWTKSIHTDAFTTRPANGGNAAFPQSWLDQFIITDSNLYFVTVVVPYQRGIG